MNEFSTEEAYLFQPAFFSGRTSNRFSVKCRVNRLSISNPGLFFVDNPYRSKRSDVSHAMALNQVVFTSDKVDIWGINQGRVRIS